MTSVAGTSVVIDHGDVCTGYAHLSKLNVSKGQRVKQGDVIGWSGATGQVEGPHLHFEFISKPWQRYNGWYGRVNPNDYLGKERTMDFEDAKKAVQMVKHRDVPTEAEVKALVGLKPIEALGRLLDAEWKGQDWVMKEEYPRVNAERGAYYDDAKRALADKDKLLSELEAAKKTIEKLKETGGAPAAIPLEAGQLYVVPESK